ncbi:MAG TPA: FtsW/RodA/SpoVE family cell cycle protein [Acidimicrobiales bacterium]
MAAPRRRTELGLILLAVVAVGATYALAAFGQNATIPADIGPFLGVILVLLLAAHLAARRWAPDADGTLLPIAGLLNGLGYVFIARLNDDLAGLQATWTAVGIGAFIATLVIVRRVRDLDRYRYTFMALGVGLLLLPLLPVVGDEVNGSRIFVSFGPVNFQPGEFAKVLLALFFASYLVEKRELLSIATWGVGPIKLPEPKHLFPVLLAWGFSLMVLFFEKDLGSSLLFFTIFVVMLWIATQRASYLLVGATLFGTGAFFAWKTFTHVQQRVDIWLDPWDLCFAEGQQICRSQFGLALGGLSGTGPGLGRFDRFPAVETDFIFTVIGEELGLLGGTLILVGFLLLVGTGLRIAAAAAHEFEKLLAAGLTALLGFQAFIIIAGVTRLLPLTGVTLPFVSYGGSSLIANYVILALLMRISDDTTRRQAERAGRRNRRPVDQGGVA